MLESTAAEGITDAYNGGVDFKEAVGLLWYTLFETQKRKRSRSFNDQISSNNSSGHDFMSTREKESAASKGSSATSADVKPAVSSIPTSTGSSPTTSFLTPQSAEEAFRTWGEVDWVLLAAHVYVLTRALHTDTSVRRLVINDIFDLQFKRDASAMATALSAAHRRLLTSYAEKAEAEVMEKRIATTTTATLAATAVNGVSAAVPTRSVSSTPAFLQTAAAASTSSSTVNASTSLSDLAVHGAAGASGPQAPITAGITQGSPPQLSLVLSYSTSPAPPGLAAAAAQDSAEVHSAPHQYSLPALSSSAGTNVRPSLNDANYHSASQVGAGGAAGEAERPDNVQKYFNASSSPFPLPKGESQGSDINLVGGSSASARLSDRGFQNNANNGSASPVSSCHFHSTVTPMLLEPDTLDAPWYALWRSLPSPLARRQLQILRFHTPLPIEDFSSLLEQFFLVDGADDFLNPVHAATIMEFAGVRSGPYYSIVRAPLSLAEVRRYITESHRQYARAASTGGHHEYGLDGKPQHHHFSSQRVSTIDRTRQKQEKTAASASISANQLGGSVSTAKVTNNSSGVNPEAEALLRWTSSQERRILTIAELERSIWHIAANCVVFNAPQSRYPHTAWRFAASCIEVITRYCEKQMAAFLAV